MNFTECPPESTLLRAATDSGLASHLGTHLAVCASCRETLRVAQHLHRLAAAEEPSLPDPDQILWKARIFRQLREREQKARRTLVFDILVQGLGLFFVFTSFLFALGLLGSPPSEQSPIWLLATPSLEVAPVRGSLAIILAMVLTPSVTFLACWYVWRQAQS